jgi:hypothetical protein
MGLYLRKSFRAGPIRFNLSKSGLGVSGGIKGARVGVGPRGSYVHAGRNGLYYREQLSSGRTRSHSNTDGGNGCAILLLISIAIGIGTWIFNWFSKHPAVCVVGVVCVIGIPLLRWVLSFRCKRQISAYKKALDVAFVVTQSSPPPATLFALKQQQKELLKNDASKKQVEKIEADIYQAVLDRILDDGFITVEETAVIADAEQILKISPLTKLQIKKEIFAAAYVKAIEDHEITKHELATLSNLMTGLVIPKTEVQRELDIIQEIIDTQSLCPPFKAISLDGLSVRTQRNENAFYQSSAQVLSKRKSKDSPSGYEYTIKRDGTMVITDKRIFVVGEGTTNIRYDEIADIDVDIDEGILEISKMSADRPIILKTKAPIYVARFIDLLVKTQATERPKTGEVD